ncbi:uncharacterized protein LOC111334984 isoform X2 [Stylophora pistillata]|uniref:uncharacterized protein LOC111334984 isoform X2 n=1 Tax=Stylophora pistillata TaxID=50429 RepID=UPI000C03EA7A|nr:uncharacterized protein LOC111334984 isoform X2 [Stylophora pistillata]
MIDDIKYEYSLPRQHFNRLLFIDKVTNKHQGNYTCTAVSASGKKRVSASTYLTVKASPEWKVRSDRKIEVQRSKNLSLMLIADGFPSPSYQWLRNGKEIDASGSRVKIEKNKLHLIHVDSWHDAVFQCVAENDQGMIVSSVWVDVEDSPTSLAPSSRSGFFSDNALWIIITAVLGVLFIVAVIIIIVFYKRRKAREHGETSDATEETPRYLDVCQSNSSAPRTNATEVTGGKKPRRRATLPPLPLYQALDPTTTAMPSYEPIDSEQDLNDSGLYEKLDFRSMKSGHEYVNPERPIPEYLELVNDTQVPPGNTASNAQTKGPGKYCYIPMENGDSNNVLNNSSPQDYVSIENGMHSKALNNSTPQDYVPMDASNMRNNPSLPMAGRSDGSAVETRDRTSSADYYQPMANNGDSCEQGSPQTSSLGDYYSPMAGSTLSGPASNANAHNEVMSSKL